MDAACIDGFCVADGDTDDETTSPGDGDGDDNGDGDDEGDGDGDEPLACDPPCPEDSICKNGECIELGTCPCPEGSYCNLMTNTCIEGCLTGADCDDDYYCDVINKQCEPGCGGDEDCPEGQYCDLSVHECTDPCAGCEDDGNPCTYESCTFGGCQTGNLRYGEACSGADDGNECTVRACDGEGTCTHLPVSEGVACDVANTCKTSECDGDGTCNTLSTLPNGTSCSEDLYEAVCLGNECSEVRFVCVGGDAVYGTDNSEPGEPFNVYECGCDWQGDFYYELYPNQPYGESICGMCISYQLLDIKVCTI
ncbi:MAG TPA: hypothetical protein VM869_23465 [Enhygromyxa sp.]|nr:hypothetical protein [Enhygromyxa sp.]